MARADCYWGVVPDTEMAAALYTATDFDRHELASWLNESLHRIHKEVRQTKFEKGFPHLCSIFSAAMASQHQALYTTREGMDFLGRRKCYSL